MSDDLSPMTEPETNSGGAPSKPKQSNPVLNIFLILVGLFFLSRGTLEFLVWFNLVPPPDWLAAVSSQLNSRDFISAFSFLGTQGITAAVIGFWAVIAGILLFREQESGWGMAMLILSVIIVMGAASVFVWFYSPSTFDLGYWPNWVTMVTLVIGLFSFVYLLATKKRYS